MIFSHRYASINLVRNYVVWVCRQPKSVAAIDNPTLEPATISFVHQDYEAEYYEPLVEEFMQLHPEITVELTHRLWE